MTIVIWLDKRYYDRSQILFESLKKNWHDKVCIVGQGFLPQIEEREGWTVAQMDECKSLIRGWPQNRDFYFCSESGECLSLFNFPDDELIIHLDADMILQRKLSEREIETLEHIEQGEIAMSPSSYPVTTLREEFYKLKPVWTYSKVNETFPGVWGSMNLLCCGMVVSRAKTYKEFSKLYLGNIDKMVVNFNHHAASQWLFNWLLVINSDLRFTSVILSNVFHNADWFIDTMAYERDNQLFYGDLNGPFDDDKVVLFNHTKFNKEYKF